MNRYIISLFINKVKEVGCNILVFGSPRTTFLKAVFIAVRGHEQPTSIVFELGYKQGTNKCKSNNVTTKLASVASDD